MTAPFECEVRLRLLDPDAFHRRLRALGAALRAAYAFTDDYYRPVGTADGAWTAGTRALRVRRHQHPPAASELLLTDVERSTIDGMAFKRSRFREGKVRLYAGETADCRRIAESLGFAPWVSVAKRDGRLFELPDLGSLVTEEVEGLGWMCELEEEGADPAAAAARLRAKLARLGVAPAEVTGDPIAALVAAVRGVAPPAGHLAPGSAVYFCGAIRGGRDRQPLYAAIVEALQRRGHRVLTTHVAAPDVLALEGGAGLSARAIFDRDMRWLEECDAVIAEVSTPSLGVGVEIAEAARRGKPILALCEAGVALSAMVAGHPAVTVRTYRDRAELLAVLEALTAAEGPDGR